jgi:hypothetical protein
LIWLGLARQICKDFGLLATSFPFKKMSSSELEHLSLAPFRFDALLDRFHGRTLHPVHTQTFTPWFNGGPIDLNTIYLIPGGRYLVTRQQDTGIHLWDLGYNADTRPKLLPLAYLSLPQGFTLFPPVPTPCRQGVRMCCTEYVSALKSYAPNTKWVHLMLHRPHGRLRILDLDLASKDPEFRELGPSC